MPLYSVDVTIGTLTTEVEAANPDDAVGAAIDEWYDDAANILSTGTFSVAEGSRKMTSEQRKRDALLFVLGYVGRRR